MLYQNRDDSEREGRCPHCGHGARTTYVVEASEVVFLVAIWEGCLTYDPSVDVNSFDGLDGLRKHLESVPGYSSMMKELFPKPSSSSSVSPLSS